MNFLFIIVPFIVLCGFVFVFGSIIYSFAQDHKRERRNDASPRLTVPATVIAKRDQQNRHRRSGANSMDHYYYTTRYFVTFQFESGDRLELEMEGGRYGLLIEGDRGSLTFQGTRYLDFERA